MSNNVEKTNGVPDSDDDVLRHKEEAVTTDSPAGSDVRVQWTFSRVVAVVSLCIVYVGSQLILYFADPALSYIAADVHTKYPNWFLSTNTLAVAAIAPFVGYITDLLGRRWIAIGGTVLLLISSIVIATGKNFAAITSGMALGGLGAGICELTALAGVAEITPVRWRGVSLAAVTFSILPFMPTVIYVLELQQAATWRWSFLIVAIWNLVGFVGIVFCYKPPPRHNVDNLSKMDIIKRIDYVGALLSIGGVTIFLVGLQLGGYQYPWHEGRVLAPLIIGILMILAFPVWEIYGAKYPMVPGAIFKGQRVVALALAIVFLGGMNFYAILAFFPLMLEFQFPPTTAIQVGTRALSYPFAILGGACIGSFLISYTRGHVRELFTISAVMMTAFGGALAATNPNTPGMAVALEFFDSFGIGAIIVPSLTLALYACPDEYIGTTTALSLTSRFIGGSVGVAVYFNIWLTKFKNALPRVAEAAIAAGLPPKEATEFVTIFTGADPSAVATLNGVTPAVEGAALFALADVYAYSLRYVWLTTIAFSALCILCCLALPNIRKFMGNRVAVDLH